VDSLERRRVQRYYADFVDAVATIFPATRHLHYGLDDGQGGLAARVRALRAGPEALLQRAAMVAGLNSVKAGARGLDLGSGLAGTSMWLAREHGFRMTGVDMTPEHVRLGRERVDAAGLSGQVTLREADAAALPYAASEFDLVTTIEMLLHVQDKARIFAEVARVLRAGGRFVVVDQENRGGLDIMDMFFFPELGTFERLGASHGLELVGFEDLSRDVARWMRTYARSASRPLLAAAGAAALARGGLPLLSRYTRGVLFFSAAIRSGAARHGVASAPFPVANPIRKVREHTADVLERGDARYGVWVFRKLA
jgi:ubiquinone/menaquinone biosynthesis C-methylase UbiE